MLNKRSFLMLLIVELIFLLIASCKPNESIPLETPTDSMPTVLKTTESEPLETATENIPTIQKTTESEPMETPTESIPMVYETKDLPYATIMLPDQKDQLLDVYQPVEEGSFPVVVLLHGFRARKEAYIDLSQELAKNGVVVFTINYPTWIPDLAVNEKGRGLREMFDVISCAIKFARVKAPDYDGDPSKLILVGHSYGAPMGAWVALGNDEITMLWNEFETNSGGPSSQVRCVENSTTNSVDGFVGISGDCFAWDPIKEKYPELWEIISPHVFLGRNLELIIRLIHGENDGLVLPEVSVQFNTALQNAGYDSKLILHDGSHDVPIELTVSEILSLIEIIDQ
jgi:predicted esterase